MLCCRNRVLLTGATGLIGKELIEPLLSAGYEVFAMTTRNCASHGGVTWLHGSVFDEVLVRRLCDDVRPSHLINLAWVTKGDYLVSPVNDRFLAAGVSLAKAFAESGGVRALYAGTCFEYAFRDRPLKETDDLEACRNNYTRCKNAVREEASAIFEQAGVSFCFGRIFYAYGRHEDRSRLTGMIIDKICRGERVVIRSGPLKKDFIYTKDIARAFVALLDKPVEGAINICSGRPVSVREYATRLAEKLGRVELLDFRDDCLGQPPCIVGDTTRLSQEVGFHADYDLGRAFDEILAAEGLP